MVRRFQNRMASSRAALPAMSIYSCALWLAMIAAEHTLLPCFVIFIVNIYLIIELNNRNALMRQYSRMVSCSYIGLMMMCPWLISSLDTMIVQLCFIASLALLFQTYQDRSAMGKTYWAFLFLGIAAVFWPPVIYFLPLFWVAESVFLMSFSWKALWASLFGMITPLWLAMPYIVYMDRYDIIIDRAMDLIPGDRIIAGFSDPMLLLPQSLPMSVEQLVAIVFILILSVTGIVHYLRNSYSDKIHVRMLYQFLLMIVIAALVVMVAVCVLPFDNVLSSSALLAISIVCVSALLAHFIAFTYTRLTNITVMLIILLMFGITVYQFLSVFMSVDPARIIDSFNDLSLPEWAKW